MKKILVISNNIFLRNLLTNLDNSEFVFADENLRDLDLKQFDLVLLESKIFDEDFLAKIKKQNIAVISFFANHQTQFDNIQILTKPIQIKVLIESIKEILQKKELEIIDFGDFVLDQKKRLAIAKNKTIKLTELETKLTKFLFQNKKYSRNQLLLEVWGQKHESESGAFETAIAGLRKKFSELQIKF